MGKLIIAKRSSVPIPLKKRQFISKPIIRKPALTNGISLIIATRHRPDFLYRCLLAVREQTYKDFECIVVSDNCEYTANVMRMFSEFKYINHKSDYVENVGAIGKNIGILNAKNNRICYCDDDNILLPNHIQTMMDNNHELVFTKFIECHYEDLPMYDILNRGLYDKPNGKEGYYDNISICHTKHLWNKVGKWKPKAEIGYNEDGNFMRRLDEVAQKVVIPEVTAIYNQSNKLFDEYKKLLHTANPIVYHELISKWI